MKNWTELTLKQAPITINDPEKNQQILGCQFIWFYGYRHFLAYGIAPYCDQITLLATDYTDLPPLIFFLSLILGQQSLKNPYRCSGTIGDCFINAINDLFSLSGGACKARGLMDIYRSARRLILWGMPQR